MPMSGYKHSYGLTPARPSGWRSAAAGLATVAAVVAVSATSGALVTLDLVAPRSLHDKASSTAETTPALVTTPASTRTSSAPSIRTTSAPSEVTASAPVKPKAVDRKAVDRQAAAQPAAPSSQPVPAPAPQPTIAAAAPSVAAAPADAQAAALPDSELTFKKGYAQRRAVQAAAEEAATRNAGAHAPADNQLGRPAVAVRKPTYARGYGSQESRRVAAHNDNIRPDSFDFRHHRALAYGEQYQNRRPQGGFFGNWFGGGNLF